MRGVLTGHPSRPGALPSWYRSRARGDSVDAANDIAEFLTSRRAKITPEQAGLPTYGTRRVPGPAPRGGRLAGRRQRRVLQAPGARQRSAASPTPCSKALARALQLDDAERAHLFDLARAVQGPAAPRRRPAAASSASARPCSASSTRSARRRSCATAALDYLAANPLGRALYAPLFDEPRAAAQQRPLHVPRPGRRGLLRRLGAASPPSSSRTCAPRPAATPTTATCPTCRRAVDPQRRVPRPLGRAQRALPPHRHQAAPPPRRRRPRAQLRVDGALRRQRAQRRTSTPPSPAARPSRRSTSSRAGRPRPPTHPPSSIDS